MILWFLKTYECCMGIVYERQIFFIFGKKKKKERKDIKKVFILIVLKHILKSDVKALFK